MQLTKWHYEKKDLKDYPPSIFSSSLSVLANSVTAANYDFLKRIPSNKSILEVGCGVTSYVKDNLKNSEWYGVDVFEFNKKGEQTIATDIASVESLPYEDNKFDFILANQSIEHWEEYRVSIVDAIDEIFRTLKVGGSAIINFPIQLHGKKEFVKADFDYINSLFSNYSREIVRRTAYYNSNEDNYKGWRRCSIPDFYVKKSKYFEESSYVVEYEVKKTIPETHKVRKDAGIQIKSRRSLLSRSLDYGVMVFLWKALRKVGLRFHY